MNDRVSSWLESLGLDRYRDVFQQHAITWDVLPELTDEDLTSLGVLLGHRKKLLRAISQLSQNSQREQAEAATIPPSATLTPPISGRDYAERRQLAVMFCDLVGSTALARRLDPEDVQEIIRRFLDACSQAVGRFNGYVVKYMGDGLLVYFGYPHAHEHDAERAVHAGLAVLDLVQALPSEDPVHQRFDIAARIGIATGQVIVGEVLGQDTARERSVFGETPNLAARLQGLAAPNQLVVDSVTKRLVGNEFEFADAGIVSLKGFDAPIQVWRVVGATPQASRFQSYRSERLTKFIGREHETALLLDRWGDAVEGLGQVVLLRGEAGIGKSRLVRCLCDRLSENDHEAIPLQCSPYHTNTALYPVMTYLRHAAGFADEDDASTQQRKIDTLMADRGLNDRVTSALLTDLLSIHSDAQNQLLNLAPDRRKDMTLEALVQYLQKLADRSPVLFIVEDAHWIDPTTLDLLTRIMNRIRRMRALVLITARPEFRPVWAESSHVSLLTLNRLARRQSAELIASMTGGKGLPQEVQEAILMKTDGVPLYLEEFMENLLRTGFLEEGADAFTLKTPLRELVIPDSLHALLMERVDRLGPGKDIIQIGAAIGREFTYELLQAVADVSDGALSNALAPVVASGLMVKEGDGSVARYQFKHALVQDAAYHTLPKKSRRLLHARIAKTVEEKFPERSQLEPELLAYHYEQARLVTQALDYWRRAARRDAAQSANIEALNHFNSALMLLEDLPAGVNRDALELDLLIVRGFPLQRVKGYASLEVERNYLRARELSQEHSESDHHFLAIRGVWVFHLVRGAYTKARILVEDLLSQAIHRHDQNMLILAHESAGFTYQFLGRYVEAKAHLIAAKELYDVHRHHSPILDYTQDPGVSARIVLARTLWVLGEVDQVDALMQEAISRARELEHPFTLAFALATSGWIYAGMGDADRILALSDEAMALSTTHSFQVTLAWATFFHSWALAHKGHQESLSRLMKVISAAQTIGANLNSTYMLTLLAGIYLRQHRIDEGLSALAEAEKLVHSLEERCWEAEIFRLRGELLLERSEQSISAAEQCFSGAMKIAQDQHAKMLELRAATSMARLLKKTEPTRSCSTHLEFGSLQVC